MALAGPIRFAWNPVLYIFSARLVVASPGPPWVSTKRRSKKVTDPTTISVDEVMIVYFSCGKVMLKNCRTRPAPSSLRRLVHRARDLPDRALVDQRVERDELPGHHEDDGGDREVRLAEPVLGLRKAMCRPAPSPKLGSSSAL